MKRQFKFRAFIKKSKMMVDFDFSSLEANNGRIMLPDGGGGCVSSSDKFIVMQYLGDDFKDEDNIDICERDIVEIYLDNGNYEKIVGEIIYHRGEFKVKIIEKYYALPIDNGDIKIIGNIYQNPELLIMEEK